MNTRADDDLFDPGVAAWFARAAEEIHVDLDTEWIRLVDRLNREDVEVAGISSDNGMGTQGSSPVRRRAGPRLLLVAAAVILVVMLMFTGPVVVRTTFNIVNFVQEVAEPPVTTTTTTTAVSLPPVTTSTTPTTTTDLAHAPILDGDEYRLTLRRVHDQLNAAIGFGREDYAALDGSDELVESLLGQRPEYDAALRDAIGHLRQAMNFRDRRAASAAHTIIDRIQRETAGG